HRLRRRQGRHASISQGPAAIDPLRAVLLPARLAYRFRRGEILPAREPRAAEKAEIEVGARLHRHSAQRHGGPFSRSEIGKRRERPRDPRGAVLRSAAAAMKPCFFPSAGHFREWLERNHDKEDVLLVGFYKRESGRPSMTWSESVDAALSFGWIDGVRKRVDATRYTIRFCRRRPRSIWSA